ncbi:hypothetical protein HRW18_30915 [Streptomyces lunaelactis]|uniref:hypothetical protein n=1 Tax=Streptomyces lunaelactis TaxID=1535768 RepID=UPI001584DE18|nr:hypothetical protein [Streptomyces lunaelactis]NUK12310.1 hypothetical protein [Streptomyces lunaelactis]
MATKTLAERADTLRAVGLAPLLTTEHVMAYYGVSNWTVNEWVKAGCPLEDTAFRGRRFDLDKVRAWHAAEATPAPQLIPSQRSA